MTTRLTSIVIEIESNQDRPNDCSNAIAAPIASSQAEAPNTTDTAAQGLRLLALACKRAAPAGASLQRIGNDPRPYERDIGGRRFTVVEHRYLLIPERSGTLVLPGARFNGMTAGGFFDRIFDDGRRPLSAAAATLFDAAYTCAL